MTSLRFITICSASALAMSPALAQEAGDSFDLGTIVLRGELQSRALQDSPTSAAVETGEALEKRGNTDLYDVD